MITGLDLIGTVAAARLRRDLVSLLVSGDGGSVARYSLHKLKPAEVAAIARAILGDSELGPGVTLRIPRRLVEEEEGVDPAVLTDENAAWARNAEVDTPMLVFASAADDLADTTSLITPVGAPELKEEYALWVAAAGDGLGLPEPQPAVWASALRGLREADDISLEHFAEYVAQTRARIAVDGQPLVNALGWALPALQVPRHSTAFVGLKAKDQEQASKWKRLFGQLVAPRRAQLRKQQASGRGGIEREALDAQYARVKGDMTPEVQAVAKAFIAAQPGWGDAAAALAKLEWEADRTNLLFENLKEQKTNNLAVQTLGYFEMEQPDRLTDVEREYLKGLQKRRTTGEPREDDVEFYEKFRGEFKDRRTLKAKWDRFIYGKGVETDDFLVGLLLAVEKLYEQADEIRGKRRLVIRSQKRTPKEWFDVNAEVLRYFSLRYNGLVALTDKFIKWDTPHLFKLEELFAKRARNKSYKLSTSVARSAVQIKFELELLVTPAGGTERKTAATQLVWEGRPAALGMELPKDLARAVKQPFSRCTVEARSVSRKGKLQSVSLDDATTLEPAFDRDAGSLIGTVDSKRDIAKRWREALDAAVRDGRVHPQGEAVLREAWDRFAGAYHGALDAWARKGIAGPEPLVQAEAFGELLGALAKHARGDLNRQKLWEPVMQVGVAAVEGGRPTVIVAPWHPLRLAAAAVKLRSVAGLLEHFVRAEDVNFGDTRLFFADLCEELRHPYYPEVVIGYDGDRPVLLAVSETRNDYSLAERPVHEAGDGATNENPRDAADRVRELLRRYLELQPHEQANLSVALYNCDSTRLPLAAVSALADFPEDDAEEVRCNVVLRHHDTARLGRLYGQMLESVDADPDAVVASETSRNFMAKLRVGIMLDPAQMPTGPNGKSIDVAFLQDVVSRRAQIEWLPVGPDATADLLHHVPARWAYKRSAAEDELKSTSYLSCPRQPNAGWAYMAAVQAIATARDPVEGARLLPARQIVFQDANVHTLFREVHGLAEWVVNYDDLLDKRQLQNQGVNVIRYQRRRGHGRNLIVSSSSPMRVLRVLVKRRLMELDLALPEERVGVLADRLINEASAISGDIVLRAAKQGVFAGELIGVVLSKAMAAEEMGPGASVGWFFLDDYAQWLGQREGRIADVLGLSAVEHEGVVGLRVVVTEAKYVGAEALADERKSSQQQLSETVRRMHDALFGNPGRLDRDLWLSRLGDLLLDSTGGPAADTRIFESLRTAVRDGSVPIELKGYSHVFVWGPLDAAVAPSQTEIPRLPGCVQEIFDRELLRALLRAYEAREPLIPVRERLGDERPWLTKRFEHPAPPVRWTVATGLPEPDGPDDAAGAPVAAAPGVSTDAVVDTGGASGSDSGSSGPAGRNASATAVSGNGYPASGPVGAPGAPEHPPQAVPQTGQRVLDAEGGGPSTTAGGYGPHLQGLIDRFATAADSAADTEWMSLAERRLRSALLGYRLSARVVGTRLTPNAALFRLEGSDNLTTQQIEARRTELLTTHALPVLSVTARPGEIVVAVERPRRQIIPLHDVLRRRQLHRRSGEINASLILGVRELDGEIQYLNLWEPFAGQPQHAPHTLIAGTTGSGKSVLLQNLLLDICATNSPRLAHIFMIDPKMGVDYPAVKRLPHLQGGIITEQSAAQNVLESLLVEMDRRYSVFAEREVKNLPRYNAKVTPEERLPAIFYVHDEFAEWMMTPDYKDAVSSGVARLGVKARAAGIHLIFAAQRPDNTVFPMQLRSNLDNRLVLKVADEGTSQIALNAKGGERLLGNGHLAARLSGEPDIVFAQVPFLSDDDFEEAAAALRADCDE